MTVWPEPLICRPQGREHGPSNPKIVQKQHGSGKTGCNLRLVTGLCLNDRITNVRRQHGLWSFVMQKLRGAVIAAAASLGLWSVDLAPAHANDVNWQGFYAGVHGGGGWAKPEDGTAELTGGLAGGQIGYNWHSGNTVFGFEADVSWSGIEDELNQKILGFDVNLTFSQDIIATTRVRFGFTQGQVLYYATIGAAYSEINLDVSVTGPGVNQSRTTRADLGGVIGGGGVEWAMDQHWSLKGEVLVSRMGRHFDVSDGLTDVIGRAGVNYRF
jgi:outer membrane immunogenic protein